MRVYETALKMAEHYHADVKKVAVAALIHDCGRQVPKETSVAKAKDLGLPVDSVEEAQPILLHAKLGVYFAVRKYGISPDDTEVLDAIRYHSTGKADMSETAKIVFLADLIEPGRDFEGVEALREASITSWRQNTGQNRLKSKRKNKETLMNQCFLKINDVQRYVPIMEQAGCASVSEKEAQL